MKSIMSTPLMFAACEPNLARLPVTQTVKPDAGIRAGGLWLTGPLFVAAPVGVIWFLLSSMLAGNLSVATFWDSVIILGALILMSVSLIFGMCEFYLLWQSHGWARTMIFGDTAIEVTENGSSGARHWSEYYTSYAGIVLHVTQGELPSHCQQLISLRHNDADRSILLHKSQGNGLDPAIQTRARSWATQLNVPLFVENETGNLVPLNLPH